VRLLLEQAGWDVCGEAIDGQDALDKARDLKPVVPGAVFSHGTIWSDSAMIPWDRGPRPIKLG